MTTTQHDLQRERILAACRLAAVASAAGVDAAAWASTSSPRVLSSDGAGGYVAGLHRGRLPAVEVWQDVAAWDRQTPGGGTQATTWRLRIHVPGPSWAAAHARASAILGVCLAAIRSDEYLGEGEETAEALQASPLGFSMVATVGLVHTYARDTYETDATITPGSPVVVLPADSMTYLAAENVGGGRVVYYDPAGPGWRLADKDAPEAATAELAVTVGAIMAGASGAAQFAGTMTDPAWNWPAPCTLYLGDAGALTATPPTEGVLREVARAVEPTRILIEPEPGIVLAIPPN